MYLLLSLLIVAFGQPAWSQPLSLVAAFAGYALFWKYLLGIESAKRRFWISAAWFAVVQTIQIWWMASHPYSYIYGLILFLSTAMGLQFGVVGLLITPRLLGSIGRMAGVAGLWTLMEWSRLFFLSGFSWNPVGMALSAYLLPLQTASLWGIYGMSFWVIFSNLLLLSCWESRFSKKSAAAFLIALIFPFAYGYGQLRWHEEAFAAQEKDSNSSYNAVLVQTAFPIEEILGFKSHQEMVSYVSEEWKQILRVTKQHLGKKVDLVALPEYVVPYGTYTFVYPHDEVVTAFREIYGPEHVKHLPAPETPLAADAGGQVMVNNAFWCQAIANVFDAELIAGLEDVEDNDDGERTYYSAALYFEPQSSEPQGRYEKRVLVPMGEYIPFEFLKKLAASYGIGGSFTCGTCAKALGKKVPFGVSICYEETFCNLMRENKGAGAQMLVNLTSDIWYPNSKLTQQHFDHGRLRSVENGFPLLRACNTGITSAFDSFGRVVSVLGEDPYESEWVADSLYTRVPTYNFWTLYSHLGDWLVVGVSVLCLGFFFERIRK